MLNKGLKNKGTIAFFILLVVLLGSVRAFEKVLFYDPFLHYFNGDYNFLPLPKFDFVRLFVSLLFRYVLNMIFSVAIIYILFKEIEFVKFSCILYGIFFGFLIIAFFGTVYYYQNQNNLMLFYIRRFLIQPVFILLFIPAFYYQKQNN